MSLVSDRDLAKTLRGLREGEMVVCGNILPGLSNEEFVWIVVEHSIHATTKVLRVTLRAYWEGIFVVQKVVSVRMDNKLSWGATTA